MEPRKFLEPHIVPTNQRIWVVRADGGRYVSHFKVGGVIALDHLAPLKFQDTGTTPFVPDFRELTDRLKKTLERAEEHPGTVTAKMTQLYKFLYDMKPGDLVITPGAGGERINFGRIIGHPRISNEAIIATPHIDVTPYEMRFLLRRAVAWGPAVTRNTLPVNVERSLRANQTVYSADEHWQAIHHLLYPTFRKDNKTFLSLRINQTSDIDNYSVSTLLGFLTDLEVFCRFLAGRESGNFDDYFQRILEQYSFDLKVKAQFMSEGDIDLSLLTEAINHIVAIGTSTGSVSTLTYLLLVYVLIFGNTKLGFDGIVDLETRQKMWEFFISRWEKRGGKIVKDRLNLAAPDYDTTPLENHAMDESPLKIEDHTKGRS